MKQVGLKTATLMGVLLASALASAAPAGKESSVKGEREAASGGGNTSSGFNGSTDVAAPSTDAARTDPDRVSSGRGGTKPWEVSGGWEGHRLIRQNDLGGAAPDKYFNYFFAAFRYDFTKYDRAELAAGIYERFIADPEETGVRADDIVAAYTRTVPLPQQFDLGIKGSVLAPTSFVSYREGLITAPRLQVRLGKRIGEYVDLTARVNGTYFIQRYTAMRDGSLPNPLARVGGALEGEVRMPFHKPLSAGLGVYTSYGWNYNASSPPPAEPGAGQAGVVADKTYTQQPIQQSYGAEAYVDYRLPQFLTGLGLNARVAFAQGDPTLGFTSVLHDGVSHYYVFYRQTSEFYAALTAHY